LARYMLSHESIMQAIGAGDFDAPEATAIAYVRDSITLLLSMFHEVQVPERSADSLIASETLQQIQSGVNTAD
jgi:hypothetical protein